MTGSGTSHVSVIVPAASWGADLQRLLGSMSRQTTRGIEVLVVGPESAEVEKDSTGQIRLRVIADKGPGDRRTIARNIGAKAASEPLLIFLDSDMEAPPGLIEACLKLQAAGVAAILLPETNSGRGLLGAIRGWERAAISREELLTFPRAMDKALFNRFHGFDEGLTGFEDLDFAARLREEGVRFEMSPIGVIHHEENLSLSSYLRKRRRYLRDAARYRAKHPLFAKTVFSPIERIRLIGRAVKHPRDVPLLAGALALRAWEVLPTR